MKRVNYATALAFAALILAGCASYQGLESKARSEDEVQRAADEPMRQKAPPFFIYRPGAGLTIEGAQGDWRVRL